MDNHGNDNNQQCSSNLLQNLTDRPSTFIHETQPFIICDGHTDNKKWKCHGNRKLQHFKQKCRARGLIEEQITTLIQTKHHTISEQLPNDQPTITDYPKQSKKRKRDLSQPNLMASSMKSLSQLSLSHQKSSTKKKKSSQNTNSSNNQVDNNCDNINFTFNKSSKYLRMPRKLLLHSLRLQLTHPIKKKKEAARFILTRLQLLDHQFCLDQIRYLYQSYYDQGMKFKMWPENILKIVQSTEYSVIQKYLENYLVLFQEQIDQYKTELASQSLTFPSTLSSLDTIDIRLQEFVRLRHIDLIRTVQYRVNKFKDDIHEKELFKRLSYYYLNTNQFETITRLTTIRKQQMNLFEKLTMFEQRILCRQLPKSLDSMLPNIDNTKLTNKHYKMLQELKRVTLNIKFQDYEEEIQQYEDLYQQEFISLQEQIQNPSSSD